MALETFDERRHTLIKALPKKALQSDVEAAIDYLDDRTRALLVHVPVKKTSKTVSMKKYLAMALKHGQNRAPRKDCTVIVHERWPYRKENGKGGLFELLGGHRPHLNADEKTDIVRGWLREYRNEMKRYREHPTTILIDTAKDFPRRPEALLSEPYYECLTGSRETYGYVSANSLVQLLDQTDGINPNDTVTFAGATLGYCPEGVIDQMTGATLGLYLGLFPQGASASLPGAPAELIQNRMTIDRGMEKSLFYQNHTGFSLGTMMDCKGSQLKIQRNAENATRQIMRGQQKIIPSF